MKINRVINIVSVLSAYFSVCGSSKSNGLQENHSNDVLFVNNEEYIPTPESTDKDLNESLSLMMEVQASGKKFTHAALATNLNVTTRVFNSTRRLLEMVVSWEPPKNGRFPDSYNLHVIPLNETDPYCRTDYYYAYINDPLAKSWKVPDAFYQLQEGIQVLPECSYSVNLESNPHNGKDSAIKTYTVPECVQNVCSCRHASTIIRPEIRATLITNFAVNITWILLGEKRSETISKFILGIGSQIMKSSSQRIVYNITWVREIRYVWDLMFYHQLYVVPSPGNYMVAVYAVDNRTCTGPVSNFTFTVPEDPHHSIGTFTKNEMMWMTVLPSASFLLAVCIAAIVAGQRCVAWSRRRFFHTDIVQQGRIQNARNWRGVYKAVSLESNRSSRVNFPSLQERNVLYVEKEIEDAKARGEADTYEISYNRLTLGREIGKGAFGRVFLARAEAIAGVPGTIIVAVKKLKNRANADELEEFQAEIAMMKRVGRHPNIVTMLGCCTIKQPYCMVMEYVPCGDLLQYLRRLRVEYDLRRSQLRSQNLPRYGDGVAASTITDSTCSYITPDTPKTMSFTLSSGRPSITGGEWSMQSSIIGSAQHRLEYVLDPRELQSFAVQIARGMAFLEEKQITHRDLAARNILVDEKKTLKISDFGLSRSGIYVNTKRRKVPLRWLSIEAMRDSLYSSKSDVWAFGIVLWEIGTLGGFPYPTVSDYDLLNFLMDGKRLEKPENISEELYSVMTVCWSHSADDRPSFADLVSYLDSNSRKQVYVDFSDLKPEYKFPPTEQLFKKASNNSNTNINNNKPT